LVADAVFFAADFVVLTAAAVFYLSAAAVFSVSAATVIVIVLTTATVFVLTAAGVFFFTIIQKLYSLSLHICLHFRLNNIIERDGIENGVELD
jgi:hypothetical protein